MTKAARRSTGARRTPALFLRLLLVPWLLCPGLTASVHADEEWTGRRIMGEALARHELFPYVFEKQTMILTDGAGNRDVRKLRRFSRLEEDGTVKYLLIFDSPLEVRGVALLAIRSSSGDEEGGIYLPAFGKELKSGTGENRGDPFLGTDFSVKDLTAEDVEDFRYERRPDRMAGKIKHFVVEAFPRNEEIERITSYSMRRHHIRQDNLFIVRTEYYDRRGRLLKHQTNHDLKRVTGNMWRADMILMENHKEQHQTLIKIDHRVFSQDYVPARMFTPTWILANRHVQSTANLLFQDDIRSPVPGEEQLPDSLQEDPGRDWQADAGKTD